MAHQFLEKLAVQNGRQKGKVHGCYAAWKNILAGNLCLLELPWMPPTEGPLAHLKTSKTSAKPDALAVL